MKELKEIYTENDKTNAPFLLAASFAGLVQFLGSYAQNGVIYWKFAPRDKALDLIDQLRTKTEPHIPSKDLFEAIETFWKKVALVRNGGIRNGEKLTS